MTAEEMRVCPLCLVEADELVDGRCATCSGPWTVDVGSFKVGDLTGVGINKDRWPNDVDDEDLYWLLSQADCWINYGESMMPERVLSLDEHCAATGMDPVEASWLVFRQAAARWSWRKSRLMEEEQDRIAELENALREPPASGEEG